MRQTARLILLTAIGTLLLSSLSGAQEGRWLGPDGTFLPFTTEAEVLDFLREGEVVARERLAKGINRHYRMLLERDGVRAHAVFRTTNVQKPRHSTGGQVYLDFRDSYAYECAAYELNRLLGLDNVPPCVVRDVGKKTGTMQLWIENTFTEEDRRRSGRTAPSSIRWARQQQTRRIFDALIYNFDRNQGNILIDEDWKLWLIDHGRAFHGLARVEELDRIIWCERGLWDELRALDRETLGRRLAGLIEEPRIDHLLGRRDLLVEHLEGLIERMGEEAVIYDAPLSGEAGGV